MLNLKDPTPFAQQALIDGDWTVADDGATVTVDNPATAGRNLGNIVTSPSNAFLSPNRFHRAQSLWFRQEFLVLYPSSVEGCEVRPMLPA